MGKNRAEGAVVGLDWDTPPEVHPQSVVAQILPLVKELRVNPDDWARLATFPRRNTASGVAHSLRRRLDLLDIEFVARANGPGSSLWGRCSPARRRYRRESVVKVEPG